jgi:hypothetical protein
MNKKEPILSGTMVSGQQGRALEFELTKKNTFIIFGALSSYTRIQRFYPEVTKP